MVPIGCIARVMFSRPRPKMLSVPAAPRSSALLNRMSTICAPDRLGKAEASSAAAPLMVGAEKLVPLHRLSSRPC
jgi:hypothetical protein